MNTLARGKRPGRNHEARRHGGYRRHSGVHTVICSQCGGRSQAVDTRGSALVSCHDCGRMISLKSLPKTDLRGARIETPRDVRRNVICRHRRKAYTGNEAAFLLLTLVVTLVFVLCFIHSMT